MSLAVAEAPRTVPNAAPEGTPTITPRNIRFMKQVPAAATWLGGDIVATAVFNALSLTFPDGERMFMDAVRHYKPVLSGPLLDDANNFITQEAIHTREHVSLNKVLDGDHYEAALQTIRAHIKNECARAEKMGPMTQLCATITLEHFTAMLGDSMLNNPAFLDGAPADIRDLWLWHAMEETEHKAVAFDVFNVATAAWGRLQRYITRMQAMIITTIEFNAHITYYASLLLEADGMNRRTARFRVLWFLFGKPAFFRRGMRGYWSWYRPGFHPWQHDNRHLLDAFRARYTPAQAA